MQRKGPDGKTIKGGDEASEDATRKVPRRSIRDRLLATEEQTDEVPPTHIATSPTADSSTSPGNDGNRPTQPGGDAPPTVYAGGPPPLPREAARHDAPPARDYVPADPPPPARAHPSSGQSPPPTRDGPSPQRDYIPADNAATKIYRPNRPSSAALTPPSEPAAPAAASGAMAQAGRPKAGTPVSADHTISDPVVGWLAIVEGPGRGASLNIGYGNNRIGRAPTENVSLDFGDEQISRENHATITFDGRHRRFYVLPGQGRNLVYVNDQPVMTPQELTGGEEILLGQTKLRFVPFCGKSFDWYQK
jgi:hypothetical protein